MGIIHRPRHTDTDWFAKGPIGPYVDVFKQLTERGYAANTFASYVAGITHFARWLRGSGWTGSTRYQSPNFLTIICPAANAPHKAPDSLMRFLQTL